MIDLSFLSPMSFGGGMGMQPMQPLQGAQGGSRFGSVANLLSGGAIGTPPGGQSGGGSLYGALTGQNQGTGLLSSPIGKGLLGMAGLGPQQDTSLGAALPGGGMVSANRFGGWNPFGGVGPSGYGWGSMAAGGQAQYPGGYQAPQDTLNLPF